jgi:hypothetical protein
MQPELPKKTMNGTNKEINHYQAEQLCSFSVLDWPVVCTEIKENETMYNTKTNIFKAQQLLNHL